MKVPLTAIRASLVLLQELLDVLVAAECHARCNLWGAALQH